MLTNWNLQRNVASAVATLGAAVLLSGCTIDGQSAPNINAPSEFALTITASASTDRVQRDGASQSTITVVARNETGAPAAGRRILVSATGPASTALSASEIVTGADGRASFSITAPPSTTVGDLITVALTPVGADGNPERASRTVSIGVTPSNTTAPSGGVTFSPPTPGVGEAVTFSASEIRDEGALCGAACTYSWSFGDGATATGMIVSRAYTSSGNKSVTLTVTDAGGVTSLPITVTVPVAPPAVPTVGTVVASPTPVNPGVEVNFDAGGATVGAGATIVDYTWVWGDGTSTETTTSAQAKHTFTQQGTFTVRTTVRDSLNRTATTTTTVAVVP
jgi:hypothetical protein